MGFATDCIHAGQEPDPSTGAIITPIFQTSTYVQEGIGKHKGYEYARTQNPTRRALEKNLAALEGGTDAYCFASGMAATQAVLSLVKTGERVVVSDNVYGGTHRLFTKVLARYGVEFSFLDASDAAAFDRERRRLRAAVDRDADEPLDEGLRHRGPRRDGPAAGRHPRRGQHLHEPVLPAPPGPGRRHRRPLDHEVPERPLRQRGGRGGGARRGPRRLAPLRPERRRRDPLSLRLLARAARHEDPGPADAAPRGERAAGGRVPAGAAEGAAGLLARLRRPPGPRDPQAPGDRFRRAHLLRPRAPARPRTAS